MSWILAGIYCGSLWLVFAKWKLIRLSLPIAIVVASVGPSLIVALLFCAQFFHPYTSVARVFDQVIPIAPQLSRSGRVSEIAVIPNVPIKKGEILFRVDPIPYANAVDRLTATLDQAIQNEKVAVASVELATATLDRAQSNLDFATKDRDRQAKLLEQDAGSKQDYDAAINRFTEANAAVAQAKAAMTQAELSIGVAQSKIVQTKTSLADAKYDLDQTTIVAPSDGYVTNLQLREGMLVGGNAGGAVMSFVSDDQESRRGVIVAAFDQKNYLRIQQGQYAEVALHGYPGDIFKGRVLNTIDVSGAGQLIASGDLPEILGSVEPTKFAVLIKLDKADQVRLPGGSQANVAVYTQDIQISGIPIMFLIRAQSWIRYLM